MPESLYCPIRKTWVAALPEEHVRQRLIAHMIHDLGFPQSHIAVEKALQHMPHLAGESPQTPLRRADIVCFGQNIHPKHALYPLLLIECKAVPLNTKVLNQVAGYNHFLKAYFIAIVNQSEIRMGWYDSLKQDYAYIDFLPAYADLVAKI